MESKKKYSMTIYIRFSVIWSKSPADTFNSFHVIDEQTNNVFIIYVYLILAFRIIIWQFDINNLRENFSPGDPGLNPGPGENFSLKLLIYICIYGCVLVCVYDIYFLWCFMYLTLISWMQLKWISEESLRRGEEEKLRNCKNYGSGRNNYGNNFKKDSWSA